LKQVFILTVLFLLVKQGFCQSAYWQQQVNYRVNVRLNDVDHALDGFVSMDYYNNSPDTLRFIWFHLWPNAFKNDKTAFSDQLLENGRTDFYFSSPDQRGYINRLDFKVGGVVAKTIDHPLNQDIIQLLLPGPLLPGGHTNIQTPFHVKLPFNFSRGGHVGQAYQATQWYPKPAVYDRKGWHPMPYLDQGEFYSEFGNYEVQITLPQNYVVAATGELQDTSEINWLKQKENDSVAMQEPTVKSTRVAVNTQKKVEPIFPPSSPQLKTIRYKQDSVHDFAWFADKRYTVKADTLLLPSGRITTAMCFFIRTPGKSKLWENSIEVIKKTVRSRSSWLGEYPYNTVTVCEADMGFAGGMEYPTITSISPLSTAAQLEGTIEHEVGHNWNYGILASNERQHPWMDEGINSYYDKRYDELYPRATAPPGFFSKRLPEDVPALALDMLIKIKKDQPIETASGNFSEINYGLVAYHKTAQWMALLSKKLGEDNFDKAMQEFYRQWQFKHPYPDDFRRVMENVSGRSLAHEFSLLTAKGALPTVPRKKEVKLYSFFNLKDGDRYHYILAAPLAGFNVYDKVMIGGLLHNYTLPRRNFQFLLAPLYATGSKQLNGLGRMNYTWFPGNNGQQFEIGLAAATFSRNSYKDSVNNTTYLRFSKIAPSVRFQFANKDPRSLVVKYLQWKTFFTRDSVTQEESISYPFTTRYLNQLRFVFENNRVLYPYKTEINLEQGEGFARLAFTGNYYFNYAKAGGMNVRVFAGKFFYLGDKTFLKQFETDRYHLNMTGPKGYEDYTYSNYFIGRNEFDKFASQQIMERDGFFKVRTDLLNDKIGRTDEWLAAVNFTSTIPSSVDPLKVLPIKIPLKLFVDLGTYAEAWNQNAATGRIIYDAGLQVSLFSNIVNIYLPILYSKVYRDYFKSTITDKRFLRNISFSIDVQRLSLRKLAPKFPF
jgi:hypothetical protein